jgi:arylsulfatase A-like enzyme
VLRDEGYATAAFVGGPLLSGYWGFSQGFDHYDDFTVVKVGDASHRGVTSPALLRVLSDWLSGWQQEPRRPFFVFLHLWDVHYDYTPPPPYDSMFDPDYAGSIDPANFEKGEHIHRGMDPRDLEHLIALYDGEIRFTDLYLGKVLDELRGAGLLDQTLVVVTSDHGDEFFEHGDKGHRKTLYDDTVLVPLVIRYPPRVPMGAVVEQPVRLMDLAPTMLSLAGVTPPAGFGSQASDPLHAGRDLSRLIAADSSAPSSGFVAFTDLHGVLASIRTERFKLILGGARRGAAEMYDLRSDPGERVNRIGLESKLRDELVQRLLAWRGEWQQRPDLAMQIDVAEQEKERLRALGYIE